MSCSTWSPSAIINISERRNWMAFSNLEPSSVWLVDLFKESTIRLRGETFCHYDFLREDHTGCCNVKRRSHASNQRRFDYVRFDNIRWIRICQSLVSCCVGSLLRLNVLTFECQCLTPINFQPHILISPEIMVMNVWPRCMSQYSTKANVSYLKTTRSKSTPQHQWWDLGQQIYLKPRKLHILSVRLYCYRWQSLDKMTAHVAATSIAHVRILGDVIPPKANLSWRM